MTDNQTTTVLSDRLHRLADDMAPAVDVVGQVRAARTRNRRQRRGRFVLLAVATAAAAAAVAVPLSIGASNASGPNGGVAGPGSPSSTAVPAPIISDEDAARSLAELAAARARALEAAQAEGWEPRSFMGVTFAVPPGARSADSVKIPPPGSPEYAEFIWHGPSLGARGNQNDGTPVVEFAQIRIQVGDGTRDHLSAAPRGMEPVSVPGTRQAYLQIVVGHPADPAHEATPADMYTELDLDMLSVDQWIHVDAQFPVGPAGEQAARDLAASIAVGAPGALPDGEHFAFVLSAGPVATPVDGLAGALTIQAADWLGSGPDDYSCLDGQDAPLNVSDFCVGTPGAEQVIGAADGPFTLQPGGDPSRTVGFAEFSSVVAAEATIPQGPVMGWLTIRDGVVVGFEQVPEQAA